VGYGPQLAVSPRGEGQPSPDVARSSSRVDQSEALCAQAGASSAERAAVGAGGAYAALGQKGA